MADENAAREINVRLVFIYNSSKETSKNVTEGAPPLLFISPGLCCTCPDPAPPSEGGHGRGDASESNQTKEPGTQNTGSYRENVQLSR